METWLKDQTTSQVFKPFFAFSLMHVDFSWRPIKIENRTEKVKRQNKPHIFSPYQPELSFIA